jgi:capsular exopolysaccharide synthesis family protein
MSDWVQEEANTTVAKRPEETIPQNGRQPSGEARPQSLSNFETISCQVHPEDRLVGCSQNHDLGAEKFRFLRHRLNQLRSRRPLSKVLITSAVPKEGKTLVAVNLTVSLARSSPRVLLVDADMRQPAIDRALGLSALPGLAEFLEGKLELAAAIKRIEPMGFYFLPGGHASSNPFELLQGLRMRELATLIEPAFDWIVFDSPPLIPFADAHCLATLADTVLLVVRSGLTPRETLQQGLAALEGINVAGVVSNASDDVDQDRYYYRYYPKSSDKDKAQAARSAEREK